MAANQKLPAERGWGQARDGLQACLKIEGGKLSFNFGESFRFKLTLRAVGSERVSLWLRTPRAWSIGVDSGHVLSFGALPGGAVDLQLEPGGEQEFNGPEIRLYRVGASVDAANGVPLLPGRYTIRAPTPFYVQDPRDPMKGIGLRVEPGPVEIEVNESPGGTSPGFLPEYRLRSQPGIAWGEAAGGLQAGLALADDREDFKTGEVVACKFFVRNLLDSPIGFSYPTQAEFDWNPDVADLQGKPQQVRFTNVLGWRVLKPLLLQPGEIVEIGQPKLALGVDLRTGSNPGPPVLDASPGRYTMSEGLLVTPAGKPALQAYIALASGKLSFTIAGESSRESSTAPKP